MGADVFKVFEEIVQRNRTILMDDVRTAIGDKAHADIAADYIDTACSQIEDEFKRWLRAYRDFKN